MLNLDTHILIFALCDELRPQERSLLSENTWSVSSIVLWELAKLVELERVALDLDDAEVVRALHQVHVPSISRSPRPRSGSTSMAIRRTS